MTIKDVWFYTCKLYLVFVGYFFVYVFAAYITRLETLLLCASLAVIALLVVIYEKKAEKVRIKFIAKRKQEISKIIKGLGVQLCIDYHDVACFKKSLRGVKRARLFEQKFQLKEDKENFFSNSIWKHTFSDVYH
jgi:hypothetical protein